MKFYAFFCCCKDGKIPNRRKLHLLDQISLHVVSTHNLHLSDVLAVRIYVT